MNPIITQSRYGNRRTIECVDSEKGIFKIYGKAHFCRQGETMFDFEGGPMLQVGEEFYGLGTIAGLDTTKRDEDQGTDACVYVSVDLNKKTIKELSNNPHVVTKINNSVREIDDHTTI